MRKCKYSNPQNNENLTSLETKNKHKCHSNTLNNKVCLFINWFGPLKFNIVNFKLIKKSITKISYNIVDLSFFEIANTIWGWSKKPICYITQSWLRWEPALKLQIFHHKGGQNVWAIEQFYSSWCVYKNVF